MYCVLLFDKSIIRTRQSFDVDPGEFSIVVTSSCTRNVDFERGSAATFQSPPPATQRESDPGRRVSDLITTGYF